MRRSVTERDTELAENGALVSADDVTRAKRLSLSPHPIVSPS